MADDLVDLLAAMSRLQRFFEDVGSPKGIGADWTLVRSSLLAGAARSPLSQHGGAGGSAADLADYLYRMADDVPLRNSTGLERLLFRWVRATEEMERLLVKICQPAPAAVAMANDGGGGQLWLVDEGYQTRYCDDCGAELPPDGCCAACEHEGGGL